MTKGSYPSRGKNSGTEPLRVGEAASGGKRWDCGTVRICRKREGRKIIQVGQENLDGINRMDRMNWDKTR